MTENEAIERLKCMRLFMQINDKASESKFLEEDYIANKMAIKALEEIQQYRAIGAAEKCWEAENKLKAQENYIKQILWERDIAIQQLEEIEISLGQNMDSVKNAIEKQKAKKPDKRADKYTNLIQYYYCPACGRYFGQAGIHSIVLFNKPKYCTCGQAISWEEKI